MAASSRLDRRSVLALILALGLVSLLADVVYEGGRSISGVVLSSLEAPAVAASAIVVGEAASYAVRPLGGWLSERLGRRGPWVVMFAGYLLGVGSIPLIALAPTWREVFALYLVERVGKGLRAPARNAIIAAASRETIGYGRAFGLHEALDQLGAIAGPIAVGLVSYSGGFRLAVALLALPGAASLATLALAFRRFSYITPSRPEEARYEGGAPIGYYIFAAASIGALAPWSLLSYHNSAMGFTIIATYYSLAMLVDAIASLIAGSALDKYGARTLAAIPAASAMASLTLLLNSSPATALAAALLYGAAMGLIESLGKAGVALLAGPSPRQYGYYGAATGLGYAASGALIGAAYSQGSVWLAAYILTLTVLALTTLHNTAKHTSRKEINP